MYTYLKKASGNLLVQGNVPRHKVFRTCFTVFIPWTSILSIVLFILFSHVCHKNNTAVLTGAIYVTLPT